MHFSFSFAHFRGARELVRGAGASVRATGARLQPSGRASSFSKRKTKRKKIVRRADGTVSLKTLFASPTLRLQRSALPSFESLDTFVVPVYQSAQVYIPIYRYRKRAGEDFSVRDEYFGYFGNCTCFDHVVDAVDLMTNTTFAVVCVAWTECCLAEQCVHASRT